MSTVRLEADIKARWLDGHCSRSPASTEELAILAVDLLVRDLGVASARAFLSQAVEHFTNLHWPLPSSTDAQAQPHVEPLGGHTAALAPGVLASSVLSSGIDAAKSVGG